MGKKILVVDDEASSLRLAQAGLQANGFEVITAQSGAEGVQKATTEKPDLIIMDVMMPDIDGPTAVQQIYENPSTNGIPVIFLTGMVTSQDEADSMGINVNNQKFPAMAKPINLKYLINLINQT